MKEGNERIKKKKSEKSKAPKNCTSLIPVRIYDDKIEAFKLQDGSYLDIIRIIPRDLENMSPDELDMEILNLIKVFKTVSVDIKIISMNFPLNTSKQREILQKHLERTEDSVRRLWIERESEELEKADRGILTREFYISIFGKNDTEFIKNKEEILKFTASGSVELTEELSKDQKIHVLTKINNMNTVEDIHEEIDFTPNITELEGEEFDDVLFQIIQPKGGISFKEPSYMQFGDGYVRCLHVYELPSNLKGYWLINLFNRKNCICTIDISTKDVNQVKKNINRSIQEEEAREATARKWQEKYDSVKRQRDLQVLFDNISTLGEVIKLCDFRIFVTAGTLQKLEELTDDILKDLTGDSYKTTVLLNEQKSEWQAFYEPYQKSHQATYVIKGLALTSEQLSIGYPFNYSELNDDEGVLLGFSNTGGVILYDPFTKTSKRKHYNSIVCGDMGSGKSTHLKKLFKQAASIGNYIRVFDVSGEFTNITNEFGGKIIKANGSDGILNPLEILQAGDDDYESYANHIKKLQAFFKCVSPDLSDAFIQQLANELQNFYKLYGLIPQSGKEITGLDASSYPTLENFRVYLRQALSIINDLDKEAITDVETALNIEKAKNIKRLLDSVDDLINNYGYIFNGHTTINNITKEKIVTFDISGLQGLKEIFYAQMQNYVSLCWDNAVVNGKKMKDLWESGTAESYEITKFLVLIDESHRWVNTSMPLLLDMIIKYMREARKYFAGIVLASQSISDFISTGDNAGMDKIKKIFEFAQYKFMFKQSSSAKEHIQNIFGKELTFSQVDRIPYLQTGETILSISGDSSLEFKEWLSKEYEDKLFSGGR